MAGDSRSVARVLTVRAGAGRYGIPLASVREIMRDLRLVPLAGAPDRVLGLAGFRGEPLAVISLAEVTGGSTAQGPPGPVVVVDLGDEGSLGLAVDDVGSVRVVTPGPSQASGGMTVEATADDGPVAVLDIDRMRTGRRAREA